MSDYRELYASVRVGAYPIGSVRWADLGPVDEGYLVDALEAVRDMCTERLGELLPPAPPPDPIPMRLPCPSCGELHIDEGEWAHRLHHTHACQHCGMVWRPAVVDTVGVRFLPGFVNDDPPPTDDEPPPTDDEPPRG